MFTPTAFITTTDALGLRLPTNCKTPSTTCVTTLKRTTSLPVLSMSQLEPTFLLNQRKQPAVPCSILLLRFTAVSTSMEVSTPLIRRMIRETESWLTARKSRITGLTLPEWEQRMEQRLHVNGTCVIRPY